MNSQEKKPASSNEVASAEQERSQIVIYKAKNGKTKIDARFDGDNVWLTQDMIASLYNKGRSTITEHIQNIFDEGELEQDSVCREFRRTGTDGKEYLVKFYNLDIVFYMMRGKFRTKWRQN